MKFIALTIILNFLAYTLASQNKAQIKKEKERLKIQDSLGIVLNEIYFY